MCPIADCGFPPFTVEPAHKEGDPPKIIFGKDMLIQKGPTIPVEIRFNPGLIHPDPAQVQAAVAAVHATPVPAKLLDALIDTGAGDSCIDETLAKELQLPLVDEINTPGVHGASKLNVYLGLYPDTLARLCAVRTLHRCEAPGRWSATHGPPRANFASANGALLRWARWHCQVSCVALTVSGKSGRARHRIRRRGSQNKKPRAG